MNTYIPKNVCSRKINFEITDGVITACEFVGGCRGNTQGLAKLVIGMTPEEVINRCKDIKCGFKSTSCPDQLACALTTALGGNN